MYLDYTQVFLIIYLVLFILLFLISLILPRLSGFDPKGTLGNFSKTKGIFWTIISSVFIPILILYAINRESVDWFIRIDFLDSSFFKIIGIIIIGIGLFIEMFAMIALGKNFRIMLPRERTELVTKGIYRYIRHPVGLSAILFMAGLMLIIPNLLCAVNFMLNCFLYNSKANFEEKYLLDAFKEEYRNYRISTGKFIPKMNFKIAGHYKN